MSFSGGEVMMLKRLAVRRSILPLGENRLRDVAQLPHYVAADAVQLADTESLLELKPALLRSLSSRFGVEAMAARLCPVELEDGSVAIFALPEYVASDQADELARRVQAAGYRAAYPPRYVLNASLLLAVARDGFSRSIGGGVMRDEQGALA